MAPLGVEKWFVLGFTADDIITSWQDARLAAAAVAAWRRAGRPAEFRVLQSGGEGEHLLYWFVSQAAARLLDEGRVHWRSFVIGERSGVPADAGDALIEDAVG